MIAPTQEKLDKIRQQGYRPVAVGCFINKHKVLMVYKAKHKLWQLPQGGIKPWENISQALIREMREELNVDIAKEDLLYVGTDLVDFPARTRGSRELKTSAGVEVAMKGKKYFFVAVKDELKDLDIRETEFDGFDWLDFESACKLAGKIYQTGKKRITLAALNLLKKNKLIK
jgi:8-oxo-dGTP pyrophosphatase MutT (NUDIX family)